MDYWIDGGRGQKREWREPVLPGGPRRRIVRAHCVEGGSGVSSINSMQIISSHMTQFHLPIGYYFSYQLNMFYMGVYGRVCHPDPAA
jgi:hypothetical protein